MRRKAAGDRGGEDSRVARLARDSRWARDSRKARDSRLSSFSSLSRLSRASRISSFSRASRLSSFARAQGLVPRLFVLLALFAAKMAAADVVIDRSSEIVLAADAPYATRLAAEELNFFLKGVLGKPLPVVAQRTARKSAIVLGVVADCGALGDRALPAGRR